MRNSLIHPSWKQLPGVIVVLSAVVFVRAGDISSPAPEKKDTVKTEKKESNPLSFWDGRLVFDLEERVRIEARENNRDFDSRLDDDNDDSWLLNRFRFGLAVKPVSWLKIYGQMQDLREAYSDRANVPGVAARKAMMRPTCARATSP